MLRVRSLLLCALLCLSASLALGQATGGSLGAQCSSAEQCQPGFECRFDRCFDPALLGDDGSEPEGLGSACSETECCPSDLACWSEGRLCLPATPSVPAIPCAGDDGTADPVDDGIARDQFCGNGDRCASGLVCFRNSCVDPPGDSDLYPNGYGNACSATNCCARGQACVSDTCMPGVVGVVGGVDCEGEQPPAMEDLDDGNAAAALSVPMMLLAALAAAAHMIKAA